MQLVHSTTPAPQRDRLLRLPDVERLTGLSKSTLYALARQGKFPKPLCISRRASAWPESRVLAWIEARIKEGGAA